MSFNWGDIIIAILSLFAGGGIWQVIKAKIDKEKTPYDMLLEMLAEQKKYYAALRNEFDTEKAKSTEKSAVIVQSQFCGLKYKHADVVCPVDKANSERLQRYCKDCIKKEETGNEND